MLAIFFPRIGANGYSLLGRAAILGLKTASLPPSQSHIAIYTDIAIVIAKQTLLGKGSKTPVTENVRAPLPPSRKAAGQKVNGKKITEKGGTPPPLTESNLEFFRRKRRFLLKKHCFWANF